MREFLTIITVFCCFAGHFTFGQNTDHAPGIYNFLENGGQWPEHVLYRAEVDAGNIWLERGGILYQFNDYSDVEEVHVGHKSKKNPKLKQHLVFAEFVGITGEFDTEEKYPSNEYYNYFLGNDESKWATGLHSYNHITYKNLYPNIDLLILEKDQELKYEFHVKPDVDPSQIAIKYSGQDKIKLQNDGQLLIKTSLGELIEQKPYAYQVKNGKIVEVECEFVLKNDVLTYKLGKYDERLELVIDPVLIFATYSGSITDNFGMTATYAYDGRGYSGGTIYGNSYPTPAAAWNTTSNFTGPNNGSGNGYGVTDVFISKYEADGTNMLWTTFIGGGNDTLGTETVHSLICDKDNNIYLYGATSSTDFPTFNAYQPNHAGGTSNSNYLYNGVYFKDQGTDIYVAKFSEDGMNLMGSTYIGGSANDGVNYRIGGGIYDDVTSYDSLTANYGDQFRGEIMLDSLNNIYIASSTRSSDFPVLNSFQNTLGGQQDGVVFKLSSDFSTLLWSSYFGGSANDACYSVKLDSSYNVVFAGGTCSSNIPGTAGGINPSYMGGKTDGFVGKITPDGSTLTQSTYIGTSTEDQTIFIEVDRWDNIYIVGNTNGAMPVTAGVYSNPNSGQFIQKLTPDLTTLTYGTVFGNGSGIPNISPSAFLVDVCGNVYVSGWGANILQGTPLSGMPVTSNAFQSTPPNGFDFYLIVLEADAQSLLYGSYLGGNQADEHVDGGTSRFDKYGVVYQSVCGGCGGYSDFPTTANAWSNNNLSFNCNNILFKYDFEILPVAEFITSQYEGCAPLTLIFDNESNDTVNFSWNFPPEANVISGGVNPEVEFPDTGTYIVTLIINDTICNLSDTAQKIITVYQQTELDVSDDTLICVPTTFDIAANSYGTATSFIWSTNSNFTDTLNSNLMDSVITVSPSGAATYYVLASSGWSLCDVIDSVQVNFKDPPDADFLTSDVEGCAPFSISLDNESNDTLNSVWEFPPEATVITGGINPEIIFTTPGIYEILLILEDPVCNLTDTAIQIITVHEEIILEVPSTMVVCDNPTIDLAANSFGTANSFIWSDDINFTDTLNAGGMDSTISVSPIVSTTYYVTISNGWTMCDLIDSVEIIYVDGAIKVMDDTNICWIDTAFLHAENLVPSVNVTWDWSPDAFLITETGNTATTSPQTSMWFYLTATTDTGCMFEDSVYVDVSMIDPSTVVATANPDSVAMGGTSLVEVFPTGYTYTWEPSDLVENPNSQSTVTTPIDQTTTYEVTIYDGSSCQYKTQVTVYAVEFVCGDYYIYVPNAFSPDGDNVNDRLFVRGQNLQELDFKVFDRWGELVFETQDQSVGWDGTFKGEQVDPDVYVFHLRAVCIDGFEHLIKGNVTLLK